MPAFYLPLAELVMLLTMLARGELAVSPMGHHAGLGERASHCEALQGQLIGHPRSLNPPWALQSAFS